MGEGDGKRGGMAGSGACTISGGKFALGTVPGAEEEKKKKKGGSGVVPGPTLLTEACLY